MTTSISAIREGLETRLKTISGLRCYARWPDTINTPAAVVRPMSGIYHITMSSPGSSEYTFEITFLAAATQKSLAIGQEILDDYLDDDGAKSIKKAIEGDVTLGGIAHSLVVSGWSSYGSMDVAGIDYIGANLAVLVWPVP